MFTYWYTCVVALQLLSPNLLMLSFAFLLKIRGLTDSNILSSFCVQNVDTMTVGDNIANVAIFGASFYKVKIQK